MDIIRISKITEDESLVTLETAVDRTEGCGYCEIGTVKQRLLNGEVIETPYAIYKNKQSIRKSC